MPPESEYSLQDLSDLAGVTPRTIRYYIAQGLLPSPDRAGPGTTYGDGHLHRLRLIRRLQREHLPLAEIRSRLAALDDATVAALMEASPTEPDAGSAIDYIRGVLEGDRSPDGALRNPALEAASPSPDGHSASPAPGYAPNIEAPRFRLAEVSQLYAGAPAPDRSQWDRILLAPDVELHVRRPLGRRQNKRVERVIEIARELLKEDQP
ncbi:MAG TPA: MerR family transcriptional regulator [Patescibacteria group bacterium]|nr:MerR family transcriptional regulator [Patescibacteria group bacterium]